MCGINLSSDIGPAPLAHIHLLGDGNQEVLSNSSKGSRLRAVIKRNGVILETTEAVNNIGGMVPVPFETVLQNGDEVCLQASFNNFLSYDEECRTIPTPSFDFVLFQDNLKFDTRNLIVPNCGGGDQVTVNIAINYTDGHTGTLEITGTRNAINDLDDLVSIPLDGNSGSFTFDTSMGNVFLNARYDPDFDSEKSSTMAVQVTDCEGWKNVEPWHGILNVLLDENGNALLDENDYLLTSNEPFNPINLDMAQTVVTGKQLHPPFRVTFDEPAAGQRIYNFTAAQLGGNTDIHTAKAIEMFVDGILVKSSAHSISGALQITSDDPQNAQPEQGWAANSIEFKITFI